jgi:hypothetical protein
MDNSLTPIALSRNGEVNPEDLEVIRERLHDKNIAVKNLGRFLRYANSLLNTSERLCKSPLDVPLAEVSCGKCTFVFSRLHHQNPPRV